MADDILGPVVSSTVLIEKREDGFLLERITILDGAIIDRETFNTEKG